MKTYKKGVYFYIELPDDLLDDYDDELEKIILNTIALNKYDIVIDLKNISYLSSFTLRIMMKGHRTALEKGRNFALVNIDDELRKFIAASRLDAVLPIYQNENELALEGGHPHPHPLDENNNSGFAYTLKKEGSVIIAALTGVLEDASLLRGFEEAIIAKIKEGSVRYIFDLENLGFIDSIGIGRFVKLNRLLVSKKGFLIFCHPNDLIKDFLSVLGLNDLIQVCDDRASAIERAKKDNAPH